MTHHRKFVVAASLVLVLTGCSAPGSSTSDDNSLTLLTVDGGEDNLALDEIVAAYEEQNDGQSVEVTYVPEDTYATKLQTALIADAPDIASPYGFGTFFSFLPLEERVFGDHDLEIDDYNPVMQSFCGLEGKVYCLGTTVGNMALFYNKAMFDDAGLPYPSSTETMSFDDFSELAEKLTVRGNEDEYVWGGGGDILQAYLDPAYYLDASGRHVDVLNDGYLNTVQTLVDMVASGSFPSAGQTLSVGGSDDGLGVQAIFTSGRMGMFIGDNFAVDALEAEGIDYGLAPVPIVAGGEAWVPTWTNGLGIPVESKHPDAAADFLTFVATEGQEIQAKYGQMPLRTSVAEDWANTEGRQQLVAVSKLARVGVFNPDQWSWNAPLIDAYKAALLGGDARTLLEDAQPKAQQANDTTWETFDEAANAAAGE